MSLKCLAEAKEPPVQSNEKPKKVRWNAEKKSELEKIKAQHYKRLRQMGKFASTTEDVTATAERAKLAELEDVFLSQLGDITTLKPDQHDRIASFLAASFGLMKKNPLNPSLIYSAAGEVRDVLTNAKRLPERLLDEAGIFLSQARMKKLNTYTKELKRKYGLNNADMSELVQESIEVGHIPKNNFLFNSDGARFVNARRYETWAGKLADKGLSPEEINTLRDLSVDVAGAFDELRLVAKSVGYYIEPLKNLGYFPRIFSRDMRERFARLIKSEDALGFTTDTTQTRQFNSLKADWGESRKTTYTVPADFELAAKFTGLGVDEIKDLLADPKEWSKWLNENIASDKVTALIDAGVFEKLPMLSREVFEVLGKAYELPYKQLNEMFVTDPAQAIRAYIGELKQPLANHGMLKTIATDGVRAGWAVTKGQLADIPENLRGNFVQLKADDIAKYYDDPNTLSQLEGLYVHRTVVDQWRSMLEISSSPTLLGQGGKIWAYISGAMNKSTLLGQGLFYVGRQFISNFVATVASGANPALYPASLFDMMRVFKGNLDSFDNTKVYARLGNKEYTKREFLKEFLRARGTDITPDTPGIRQTGVQFDALNPANLSRWLNYYTSYHRAFGAKAGAGYIASSLNEVLSEAFAPVAAMANLMDMTAKWNAFKSFVDRGAPTNAFNTIGGLATGENILNASRRFDNLQDLGRYVDEYFPMFDNMGTATKFVGRYILPFASFAMLNPTMQLRHLIRKPVKYANYLRLLQAYNYSNDGNELPEAAFPDYMDDEYALVTKYDKQTKTAFTLFPNNYDPLTDAIDFFDDSEKFVRRQFFGEYTGNSRDQRKQAMGEDGWQGLISGVLGKSYYGRTAALLQGIDPATGEKKDNTKKNTYLGVPMSPLMEGLVGSIPFVDNINRANYGDIFGRKEQRDSTGKTVIPGKKSVFGYERTDSDAYASTWDRGDLSDRFALLTGAKVRVMDVGKNIVGTYKEMDALHAQLKKRNFAEQQELSTQKNTLPPQQFAERRAKLAHSIDVEYQMLEDMARLKRYADREGIRDVEDVYKGLQQQRLVLEGLPLVGRDVRQEIENSYVRRQQELRDTKR